MLTYKRPPTKPFQMFIFGHVFNCIHLLNVAFQSQINCKSKQKILQDVHTSIFGKFQVSLLTTGRIA